MSTHPIYTAPGARRVFAGYDTTLAVRVLDADGQPLDLSVATVTAALGDADPGRDATPLATEPADAGALLVHLPASVLAPYAERQAMLGVRLHLGAGVIYEVQALLRVIAGRAGTAGEDQAAEGIIVTITGASSPGVRVEWTSLRDLSAAIAEAQALRQSVDTAAQEIEGARDQALTQISEARTGALTQIAEAGQAERQSVTEAGGAALDSIEQRRQQAVQAVGEAETTTITQATQEGVQAVQQQQTESVQAVADRQQQAEGAIEERQQEATDAVGQAQTGAVGAVESARDDATQAVTAQGDAEVQRVITEGNTQVGRLDERVPSPVGQPDGLALVTQGGAYVLADVVATHHLLAASAITSSRLVAWDDFGRLDRSLDGDTMPSGQVWTSGGDTAGRRVEIIGRAATSESTLTATRWAIYPEVNPSGLYHRALVGLRDGSSATALLLLAWVNPDNYLAAGIYDGGTSLQIRLRSAAVTSVLGSTSLGGGTLVYRSLVGILEAQLRPLQSGQRHIWAALQGVSVLVNAGGHAGVDAVLAAATHCGIMLNRSDTVESYLAYRGPGG